MEREYRFFVRAVVLVCAGIVGGSCAEGGDEIATGGGEAGKGWRAGGEAGSIIVQAPAGGSGGTGGYANGGSGGIAPDSGGSGGFAAGGAGGSGGFAAGGAGGFAAGGSGGTGGEQAGGAAGAGGEQTGGAAGTGGEQTGGAAGTGGEGPETKTCKDVFKEHETNECQKCMVDNCCTEVETCYNKTKAASDSSSCGEKFACVYNDCWEASSFETCANGCGNVDDTDIVEFNDAASCLEPLKGKCGSVCTK